MRLMWGARLRLRVLLSREVDMPIATQPISQPISITTTRFVCG
jgi:hypothetical protein